MTVALATAPAAHRVRAALKGKQVHATRPRDPDVRAVSVDCDRIESRPPVAHHMLRLAGVVRHEHLQRIAVEGVHLRVAATVPTPKIQPTLG